jgi:hypothetical protein
LKEKGVPSKDLVMIKLVQINMVICRLCPEKKENQENQVHVTITMVHKGMQNKTRCFS